MRVQGGHHLRGANAEPDKYKRSSSHVDGAWSILTGIAANASIASGEAIDVDRMLGENGISLPRQW